MDRDQARVFLAEACSAALGRALTDTELVVMANFLEMLAKWQGTQRLVSSGDPAWIARALVADSLLFLRVLDDSVCRLVDIGSGAGFPGIPIKIIRPEISVTLVESRRRRASFLRAVVRELPLPSTQVIDQRLESLRPEVAGLFDAAVMRCAGDPGRLLPLALPLLRQRGMVVVSGPPVRERSITPGRRSRDADRDVAGLESVVVSGIDGMPRQFLVARKA